MSEATNAIITTVGEKFYNTKELAEMLSLSEYTIRDLIRKGKLPAVKIGKAWKCSHTLLTQFMYERANFNQK